MSGFVLDNTMASILGGGIQGSQPSGGLLGGGAGAGGGSGMNGGQIRGMDRKILRQAFGNSSRDWGSDGIGVGRAPLNTPSTINICGPFRAAMSAGDLITPLTGGGQPANPKYGTISNLVSGVGTNWLKNTGDGLGSGGATYVGNPKYVYDSSDFIKFKKLKAKLRTYNDSSFGGSIGQSAASALSRVR